MVSPLRAGRPVVRCTAYAKINLFLEITGRRADGYHQLQSLMAFVTVGDFLSMAPDSALSLDVEGPYGSATPTGPDNLVLAAARAMVDLAEESSGAYLKLTKNLPAAAGLGGGSADAAAAMRGLAALWDVDINAPTIQTAALSLGADVPFCLGGQAAHVAGIGERLSPVADLPPLGVLLANPGRPLATAAVFKRYADSGPAYAPSRSPEVWPDDPHDLAEAIRGRSNDLTPAALDLMPQLESLLTTLAGLDGALLARMSGSGATCFALFTTTEEAERAAVSLNQGRAGLWTAAAALASCTPPIERRLDPA